ncbi:MAG: head-tail adaptor protein [Anaerovoracaceae bacterium]|uniref:head-tail adaptor protein n=1 Tax=Chryseobacterium sp. TaxID=1871047 RepID=UPI002FC9F463
MNIGKLNVKVQIIKPIEICDEEYNVYEKRDKVIAKVWANISSRTGSMLSGRDAGTMLAKTTHVITMRSRGDVNEDCHLIWEDEFKKIHKFEIDYILPPNKNSLMMIYVSEERDGN